MPIFPLSALLCIKYPTKLLESDFSKQKSFSKRHLPQNINQLSSQRDTEKEIIYSEAINNCQERKYFFILVC
ncbi:MAG: hypothetical protein D3922_08835 [Candidatus Electrothrix sp. AR1]|nr:hypothetical protein [Candidatus Electrothrix sp. AR1]